MSSYLIEIILCSNSKWPADVTGPRTIVWEPYLIIATEDDEPGTRIEKTAPCIKLEYRADQLGSDD